MQAGIARIGLLAIALCLALSTPCVAAPTTMGLITSLRGNVLDPVKLTLARWVHRVRFNDETLYGLEDPRIKAVIASVPMAAPIDMGSMAHPHAAVGLIEAGQDQWLAPASTSTPCAPSALRASCSGT